ncbi:MAG: ADP-ribosylation factor-like protein, partial [Myxococcota bacterium]
RGRHPRPAHPRQEGEDLMAERNEDRGEVNARILYWGVEGAGKTRCIQVIAERLRADHRGRLRALPTGLDPSATYDLLPIELGQVGGLRTRIQIIGVPGAPEHAPTRKQLLDGVDGVVFVIDAQRERIDENLASLDELRASLAAYGRPLSEVPLVIQYNKRDLSDPFTLEELHRKLDMRGVATFESVATDGSAVLQALTTASKAVVRQLRAREDVPSPPADAPSVEVESVSGGGLALHSAEPAERVDGRTLRVPLQLEDDDGNRLTVALTLTLGDLVPDPGG